jgi:hypothetical protein
MLRFFKFILKRRLLRDLTDFEMENTWGASGGDSSSPPQPDPEYDAILQQQVNLSTQAQKFAEDAYNQNEGQQLQLDSQTEAINANTIKAQDTDYADSQQIYSAYDQYGLPVQEQSIQDAEDYDSTANRNLYAGEAAANENQAYGQIEQENDDNLSRYGISPNAAAMSDINTQLLGQQAAAVAGAENSSDVNTRNTAIALRQTAANTASSMAGEALNYSNSGNQAGATATGNSIGTQSVGDQTTSVGQQGLASAASDLNAASNTAGTMYGDEMRGWQEQQQQSANSSAGLGSALGTIAGGVMGGPVGAALGSAIGGAITKADGGGLGGHPDNSGHRGGAIYGPGTGISDSVTAQNTDTGEPVKLSNGEFIIPADVVHKLGTKFFDNLIDKHHVPAALQRRYGQG